MATGCGASFPLETPLPSAEVAFIFGVP